MQALLTNPHYRGAYKVTDKKYKETIEITCEPVLSPEQIQRFDAVHNSRRTLRDGESNMKNFYLLRGLLCCGHCGSTMGGRIYPAQNRSAYYCTRHERLRDDPYSREKNLTKCVKGPYLRIQETNEAIWSKVVEVMEQSHLYQEEIKQLSLNAKKAGFAEMVDSKSLRAQIRRSEREIQDVKRSIISVESDRIIQKRGNDVVAGVLENLDKHLQAIEARKLDLLSRLKNAAKMKRWTNWVADFGARITELKTMEDEAKKEFLEGVVSTITAKTVGENHSECPVHFRLTYADEGRDSATVPLVFTAVKRRRRNRS